MGLMTKEMTRVLAADRRSTIGKMPVQKEVSLDYKIENKVILQEQIEIITKAEEKEALRDAYLQLKIMNELLNETERKMSRLSLYSKSQELQDSFANLKHKKTQIQACLFGGEEHTKLVEANEHYAKNREYLRNKILKSLLQ